MYDKYEDLAEFLMYFRENNKLSLRQFADITGLSFSYLSKIERRDVLPPKDTVGVIAEKLDLSAYHLMLLAGYVVNLYSDIKTKELNWDFQDLKKNINMRYRIVAIDNFGFTIEIRRMSFQLLSIATNIDEEKLRNILHRRDYPTVEEVLELCISLNVNFFELFKIRKANPDVKFIGSEDDEDVALSLTKYIENVKLNQRSLSGLSEIAVTKEKINDDPILDRELKELFKSVRTLDEVMYLNESLKVFRNLRLKSERM